MQDWSWPRSGDLLLSVCRWLTWKDLLRSNWTFYQLSYRTYNRIKTCKHPHKCNAGTLSSMSSVAGTNYLADLWGWLECLWLRLRSTCYLDPSPSIVMERDWENKQIHVYVSACIADSERQENLSLANRFRPWYETCSAESSYHDTVSYPCCKRHVLRAWKGPKENLCYKHFWKIRISCELTSGSGKKPTSPLSKEWWSALDSKRP